MKIMFLVLLLTSGCGVSRYYKTSEVTTELTNNEAQLQTIVAYLIQDYENKKMFLDFYEEQSEKNITTSFFKDDLQSRLIDLRDKRDAIIAQVKYIQSFNKQLLSSIGGQKKIREKDPLYDKVESFSKVSQGDARILFYNLETYKRSSEDFERFTMLTRNTI